MGDLLFVIKTFFLTVIVVLILQVKIGDFTLEERSMSWVRSSIFVGHLQEVANGSIVLMDKGIQKLKYLFSANTEQAMQDDDAPGHRKLMNVERSKEYLAEKAELAKDAVAKAADKTADKVREFHDEVLEDNVDANDLEEE